MDSFEKGVCFVFLLIAILIFGIVESVQETKREMMKYGYCETTVVGSPSAVYAKCESK